MNGEFFIPDFKVVASGSYPNTNKQVSLNAGYLINQNDVCLNPVTAYLYAGKQVFLELQVAFFDTTRYAIGFSLMVYTNVTGGGGKTQPVMCTNKPTNPPFRESLAGVWQQCINDIFNFTKWIDNPAINAQIISDGKQMQGDYYEIFRNSKQLSLF